MNSSNKTKFCFKRKWGKCEAWHCIKVNKWGYIFQTQSLKEKSVQTKCKTHSEISESKWLKDCIARKTQIWMVSTLSAICWGRLF